MGNHPSHSNPAAYHVTGARGNQGASHGSPLQLMTHRASEAPRSPQPGSPLTYTPQPAMEPPPAVLSASPSVTSDGQPAGFDGRTPAWPAQPRMIPTVIVWTQGGDHVEVQGSFDGWQQRHLMQRSGKDHTIVLLLQPGVYQYKFIVDGKWRYATDQPADYDEQKNVNNYIEVQEYVPENLESLTSFEPPASPQDSYSNPPPAPDDYVKEPPMLPPHLQLTVLNAPAARDAAASLPRPSHVILNHVYYHRSTNVPNAIVIGTTNRYKSKYVTTVLYKAKRPVENSRLVSSPAGGFLQSTPPSN
eukprot:jgi/Botrbrau1/15022/Bobra.320_2s0002.1